MSNYDNGFAKAQRAYDNAEPPGYDWEGVMQRSCEREVEREITNVLGYREEVTSICYFSGEVDAQAEGTMLYWVCPNCGHEHEDDMTPEDEPDPDYLHDTRFE